MVDLQTLSLRRPALLCCLVLLAPLALLSGGCATTDAAKLALAAPPVGKPREAHAFWKPTVQVYPDIVNNGRPTPALSARVYLVDNQGGFIVADGTMVVSAYEDHARTGANGEPVPIQIWKITPECLKQMQARDCTGWGYSLNLPWDTYRPDIGQIRLQVRFDPPKEAQDQFPLFSDSMVTLQNNGGNGQVTAQNSSRYALPSAQPIVQVQAVQPAANAQLNNLNPQVTVPVNVGNPPALMPVNNGNQPLMNLTGMRSQQGGGQANGFGNPSQFNNGGPQGLVQGNGAGTPATMQNPGYYAQGAVQATGAGNQGPMQGSNGSPQGTMQYYGGSNQGTMPMNGPGPQMPLQGNGGGTQAALPYVPFNQPQQ